MILPRNGLLRVCSLVVQVRQKGASDAFHASSSRHEPRLAAPALAANLTIEDVRYMAFDKGIVKIEEIELHKGIWKVEGEDAGGHEIEMKVDAWSGRIVKLKRDD